MDIVPPTFIVLTAALMLFGASWHEHDETVEFPVRPGPAVVFTGVFVEQIEALKNLAAYTGHIAVEQIPADAWLAEPVPNPSPETA